MKIISWNINGLNSIIKKGFFNLINKLNADIICLQEIRINGEVGFPSNFNYNNYFNFSNRKGYSGTAIFSRSKPNSVEKNMGFTRFDNEGRFLRLNFSDFILINVYMPHGNRDKRDLEYKLSCYKKLLTYLNNLKDKNVVVVGDFNVAHDEIDLANPKTNKNNIMFGFEERKMLDVLSEGFVDSFRFFNPDAQKFSWWPYYNNLRQRNIGWRIDYVFVSKNFIDNLTCSDILNEIFGSDHCPVEVKLK